MDIASIIGIIAGIGFVLYGYTMDGGVISSLWMPSAVVITVGGSVGAVILAYDLKTLKKMPKLLLELFISPKSKINDTIEYLITLSQTAKQNGLFSLEKAVMSEDPKKKIDPFLKRGILNVVDGTDTEKISELMQNEIDVYEQNKLQAISMFETSAALAPAFGMIGTIVGMIQMLSAGMDNPDTLTKAIGVAFITTLYGSLLANCLFQPVATKLRTRLAEYRLEKEMIIDAVCAIRNGINPKMLREQLFSYMILSPKSKKKTEKPGKKGEIK
ncbi:MAG TPA: motility protein A [Clostridiales bacterium]|nr:motility protein A [Clostridiales bacterium]